MIKNRMILLVLYFLQFYRNSLPGKEYFANLTNSQEPEPFFLAPWSRSRSRFGVGAGAALEKKQEPEPLKN